MSDPTTIAAGYIQKAERALDEARFLLQGDKTEGACSRAYYAMHDAAHAALFANGDESQDAMLRTHHGLIAEFGRKIVLGGHIEASFGRALNRVQDIRLLADYDSQSPSRDDARWAVDQAEAFVAAIKARFGV
jgi:uncharacterized protein (UPF0332 family)